MVEVSRITGAAVLERVLKRLPGQISERLLANALRAGGRVIQEEARARVPVKTGRLRDSIIVTKVPSEGQGVVVTVGTSRKAPYGHLVEFGTRHSSPRPFLRPAFDARAGEALDKIGDTLGRAIDRAAERLAGARSGLARRRRR